VTVPTPTLPRAYRPAIPTRTSIGQIRAVCLDVDDTLVDYVAAARAGLAALIGHDGAWVHWAQLTDLYHGRVLAGQVDFETMRLQRTRAFFAERGECLSDAEVAAHEARRMDAMRGAWRLFDDVLPCLHLLRAAGLMLAAITNASSRQQRSKLATVGLIDTFDVLVIAEEAGVSKPHPEIFHLACRKLRVRPHQTMHVGDRLDIDAQASVSAGLSGVWLVRRTAEAPFDRVPPGVHVINGLLELPALLTTLAAA